jgi:hypothetical protein
VATREARQHTASAYDAGSVPMILKILRVRQAPE